MRAVTESRRKGVSFIYPSVVFGGGSKTIVVQRVRGAGELFEGQSEGGKKASAGGSDGSAAIGDDVADAGAFRDEAGDHLRPVKNGGPAGRDLVADALKEEQLGLGGVELEAFGNSLVRGIVGG